jgi:hypothetical protein
MAADKPLTGAQMPKDAAQLVLWSKGLSQPTAFLVLRTDADKAMQAFADGADHVEFLSYPDGRGLRSQSVFLVSDLRGATIEYPTIQIASAH